MVDTRAGMVMLARRLQLPKVWLAIMVMPVGIVKLSMLAQLKNAAPPIFVTLFGMVTLKNQLLANAEAPMLVTLLGIVTLHRG